MYLVEVQTLNVGELGILLGGSFVCSIFVGQCNRSKEPSVQVCKVFGPGVLQNKRRKV